MVIHRRPVSRLRLAITLSLLVAAGGSAYATWTDFDISFYQNGSNVVCIADVTDPINYISVQVRLYAPDDTLLDFDNVAGSDYVRAYTAAGIVGSGTYRCTVEIHATEGYFETRYLVVN